MTSTPILIVVSVTPGRPERASWTGVPPLLPSGADAAGAVPPVTEAAAPGAVAEPPRDAPVPAPAAREVPSEFCCAGAPTPAADPPSPDVVACDPGTVVPHAVAKRSPATASSDLVRIAT